MKIEGNFPAVVTPFTENGDILYDHFAEVVQWHVDRGCDGICVAGDNGEAWTLDVDERRNLAETAVRQVSGRVPVLMGASTTTARQSIAYAEAAAEAGVDALMVGPQPYVLKATTAEIVDRFSAIHAAVPLPMVVYNSPRRTGLEMAPDIFGAVCDAVPVLGVKEASRDFFHLTNMIQRFGERVCIFVGPAAYIFPGLAMGARGFISSGPELFGDQASRICSLASKKPCPEARTLHFGLTRIYQTLMGTGTWPAALKTALNLIGVPAGVPREPVQTLTPEAAAHVKEVMEELGILTCDRRPP